MRRGRPIKYPRPADCPHLDRPEHANGVCYQCSSNINNQRKREKKLEEGSTPEPKRRRRRTDGEYEEIEIEYSDFVELNVGGKIFGTTIGTVNREMSLISVLLSGQHTYSRYDKMGRLFIDRDPTYFRWILNYLRDGYLVTIPAELHIRMQILQEARYYSLNSLSTIISNPHQTQQIHPNLQALQAQQALARQQTYVYQQYLALQQLHQRAQEQKLLEAENPEMKTEKPETPSFLTARPSTRGIFYLADGKWTTFFPSQPLSTIGVRFEDASDQVKLLSVSLVLQDSYLPVCQSTQEMCRVPLQVGETAIVNVVLFGQSVEAVFWWEPSTSQYPQLMGKFTKEDVCLAGPLDYVQVE